MSKQKVSQFELIGFVLILVNIFIFLYFIHRLNQIESVARTTQMQAQAIFNSLSQ